MSCSFPEPLDKGIKGFPGNGSPGFGIGSSVGPIPETSKPAKIGEETMIPTFHLGETFPIDGVDLLTELSTILSVCFHVW